MKSLLYIIAEVNKLGGRSEFWVIEKQVGKLKYFIEMKAHR